MSAFVLRREYALQLPNSYVEIDRDEMEYVDGGYGIDFSTNWISYTVDISLLFFGGAKLAEGLAKAALKLGKYQLSVAITYTTMAVTNWLGKNVSYAAVLSKVTGVLGIITNYSPGNAIAYVIDSIDATGRNGRVQF